MSIPMIGEVFGGDTARARRNDPLESHAAADSISTDAREASEREVLTILRMLGGATDEQIATVHAYGRPRFSPSRLRTARHQLTEKGLVVADCEGRTSSGRRAQLWKVAP